ncbi:MAG TPA: universal stress protein [Nitrososphaeraceae archaeon]
MSTKGQFSKILVAIDGSETSMRAADYAINISKKQKQEEKQEEENAADLIGLTVIDLTKLPDSFLAAASGYYRAKDLEEKIKEAQQWLDKVKELAKEQNYDIRHFKSGIIEDTTSSRIGSAIVDYAERQNIDLIVLGTRGRTGLRKMLLGSVASDVVTYAHCPVIVVK